MTTSSGEKEPVSDTEIVASNLKDTLKEHFEYEKYHGREGAAFAISDAMTDILGRKHEDSAEKVRENLFREEAGRQ